jgi:hypothetical protein
MRMMSKIVPADITLFLAGGRPRRASLGRVGPNAGGAGFRSQFARAAISSAHALLSPCTPSLRSLQRPSSPSLWRQLLAVTGAFLRLAGRSSKRRWGSERSTDYQSVEGGLDVI